MVCGHAGCSQPKIFQRPGGWDRRGVRRALRTLRIMGHCLARCNTAAADRHGAGRFILLLVVHRQGVKVSLNHWYQFSVERFAGDARVLADFFSPGIPDLRINPAGR